MSIKTTVVLHAAETIKGGVATVLRQLLSGGGSRSRHIEAYCLVPAEHLSELPDRSPKRTVSYRRSGRDLLSLARFAFALWGAVVRVRPNVVHLHSTFAGAVGRVVLLPLRPFLGFKVVYCPHAFAFSMSSRKASVLIASLVERVLTRMTDAVICVSEFERQCAIERGLQRLKLHVVRNGVPDVAEDNPPNPFASGVTNLLFVGRFDFQKGFDILLSAMECLEGSPFHLTAVGGAVNEEFEPPPRTNISYTGWLGSKELPAYFRHADVVVLPSRWEGLPMVGLEALSYGLPIIASRASSLPELVGEDGCGVLVEPENPEALADAIASLEASERRLIQQRARARYLANFTSSRMIDDTCDVYDAVR